jgi:hypothetical protein
LTVTNGGNHENLSFAGSYTTSTPCRKFEPFWAWIRRPGVYPSWSSGTASPSWH